MQWSASEIKELSPILDLIQNDLEPLDRKNILVLYWIQFAGLVDIAAVDLTSIVQRVWARRQKQDQAPDHQMGYSLLFEDSPAKLGDGLFYIYIRGTKPG